MPKPIKPPASDNYAFLLSGLLLLFLLIPLMRSFPNLREDDLLMGIGLQIGYCTLMLLGVWSMHRENRLFRLGLGVAVLIVTLAVISIFYRSVILDICTDIVVLTFSASSAFMAARHVFGATKVDRNLLFGALCIYLLMGLIWAVLYRLIFQFLPGAFDGLANVHGAATMDNLLYYSFVTLAGLGYGDITPVAPMARTFAYMEVIAGQLYIAIMLAGLVSIFLSDRTSR